MGVNLQSNLNKIHARRDRYMLSHLEVWGATPRRIFINLHKISFRYVIDFSPPYDAKRFFWVSKVFKPVKTE